MNSVNDQQKYLAQWIISLGVSVVCCAVLFIVFATYIMNVHDKAAITAIRLEIMQDRQNQMVAQIDAIIRAMPQSVRGQNVMPSQPAAPADGVRLTPEDNEAEKMPPQPPASTEAKPAQQPVKKTPAKP